MISVLSTTEQTDQLSTSRDVLTVVSNLYDRATVSGRTSAYGRTSEAVCHVRNTLAGAEVPKKNDQSKKSIHCV
jgi:hypothetical protein